MTNGPVEAAFTVYADFPNYKSGNDLIFLGRKFQTIISVELKNIHIKSLRMLFMCWQVWVFVAIVYIKYVLCFYDAFHTFG